MNQVFFHFSVERQMMLIRNCYAGAGNGAAGNGAAGKAAAGNGAAGNGAASVSGADASGKGSVVRGGEYGYAIASFADNKSSPDGNDFASYSAKLTAERDVEDEANSDDAKFASSSSSSSTQPDAEVKTASIGRISVNRRDAPQGTPSGARRALGFSNSTDASKSSAKNSAPKTLTSPRSKPWK